ncbi:DeoR/GlpR family DNA-binding transcription regulator [Enterococcus sp. ALS3]|uniref:Lactose phosphotransferase system repressor n=1 Tax=Enterococcus alishanensis TaxID=1303817 RepID=A0ABS6TCD2_9ENTE|nr:DeoR/GlpR family DNA-binding transcription regulator [Enterococcus alishanensis]MBV7390552.1 DeoR/GlpR family DNA-binding transcription regulator [Enterococcus alishanensis]
MLKRERQNLILEELNAKKKILAIDLSRKFEVSEDTIRRDLRELDQLGLVKRIYSGAISLGPAVTTFEQRLSSNVEKKQALVAQTLPLLTEDSVILIDGGTTNLELVKALPEEFSATIVTNSPFITIEAIKKRNIKTIALGGIVAKRAAISLGVEALTVLDEMRIDTYLMGIYNFHPEIGVTVHSQQESQMKQKMCQVSDEVIAMASADKLNVYSNYICCTPEVVTILVTDAKDQKLLAEFSKKNIHVKPA